MSINESQLFDYLTGLYQSLDSKLKDLTVAHDLLKKHISGLYSLMYGNHEIPPAQGHLKLQQDGCLKLLRMIDKTLKKSGIQYFLGYGSLLGAARNGKFIPWDDDIDICLMRDDFNRAVSVLKQEFNHDLFSTQWGISGGIFKVFFTRNICVDLFPWDFYYTRMQTPDEINTFADQYIVAMNAARQMENDRKILIEFPYTEIKPQYENYTEIRDDIIMKHRQPNKIDGDIFEGIDWQTFAERRSNFYHSRPFRYEWIFPLSKIEFCGYEFPAPNNLDAWLTTRFGDWHECRPDFSRHSRNAFSWGELNAIKKFISYTTL